MDKGRSIYSNIDYLEYVNKSGNIKNLCELVSKATDLSEEDVIFKLPNAMTKLTEKQRTVLRRYYLQQDTVYNIRNDMKFSSYRYVDKYLDSIVKKIIKHI